MLRFFTTIKKDEITSLAIGGFDGMHLGHMALVKELDDKGVLLVIDKGFSNLTPDEYRCRFVKNGCVVLNLEMIKSFSVDEFIEFLNSSFPSLKKIVVGYDFRFGRDRVGKAESFKKYFDVKTVDEVVVNGISVHSNIIRDFIKSAKFEKANKLLGRSYKVVGEHIKGQGIGAKELVATINLKTNFLLPKDGVYATKTFIAGKEYKSVSFIGKRETTDGKEAFETHLLDTKINLLEKTVEVEFVKFIRANKKFDTIESLKQQIKEDISKVKESF